MYGINYDGLRKRESYESLINYLQNDQDKIKYPDRKATRVKNDPTLSTLLDGKGEGVLKKDGTATKTQNDEQTNRPYYD